MALNKLSHAVLKLPRFLKRLIVFLVDINLTLTSVFLAFYLRLGEWNFLNQGQGEYSIDLVSEVAFFLAIPIFAYSGLYREIFRYSGWSASLTLARAITLYGVVFFFTFGLVGIKGVPRTIGLIQPIVLLILIGSSRALASYWLSTPYRKQLGLAALPNVLIYGAGDAGRQLMGALSHSYEMQVVGFLDDDPRIHGSTLGGRRIYSPKRLIELTASLNVYEVLLAIPSAGRFRRNQIIKLVRDAKVGIRTLPSMSDLASGKVSIQDLRSLDIDDLLGRDLVLPDLDLLTKNNHRKTVLVTGAGGSVGSELCRQLVELIPQTLVLVDQSEYALYQIHHEMTTRLQNHGKLKIQIIPLLTSVTNSDRMRLIVREWRPNVIYHAAAYKHVPLVESNVVEGIQNNAIGTMTVAQIAVECEVPNFILISTDKAVRPTNVMGASKRLAEMILQALAQNSVKTKFSMVRFGNVLNSSGSVVPKFRQQIKAGGPVTVTDFNMTRYFMTIPEAAQLVIQAGALSTGGDVFLLDMGEPVKIVDLARRIIELSGLVVKDEQNPEGDIEIDEIGMRPGEKLYEELLIGESSQPTMHPKIMKANEEFLSWDDLQQELEKLKLAMNASDAKLIREILKRLVSGYQPSVDIGESDVIEISIK